MMESLRKKPILLLLLAVLLSAGSFLAALDVDLGADFNDVGFARGDALNYKFSQLRDAFYYNFPPATATQWYSFTVSTTGTSLFPWPAASFSCNPYDDRLHVAINGIEQIMDRDYFQPTVTSIQFDAGLIASSVVSMWRTLSGETPVRYHFDVATSGTSLFSWTYAEMPYPADNGRTHVFLNGIRQIPLVDYYQPSDTSIQFDVALASGTLVYIWRN
jgi:hypothetical protein